MPTNFDLVIHLFLQLTLILATCRIVGRLFRYLGQTQVVSEMIAGVLLGPSLFGLLAPELQQYLFPTSLTLSLGGATKTVTHPSMIILYTLSQIGLVLYMFLIGLEFNTDLISKHFKHAGSISVSGVVAPMTIGAALGAAFSGHPQLFSRGIAPWHAALFLASAMSITAFPMLARILYEKGIARTKIGTLAIGAAAFDDATAWSLLAVVLAMTRSSPGIAVLAIGGGLVYALVMVYWGRSRFRYFDRAVVRDGGLQIETLVLLLLVLMLCAWFTDLVGIYSIFGAFIVGVVMPRGHFADECRHRLEPLTVAILLPIFFVYSGLNTRMELIVHPSLLGITIVIIGAAFLCKGGACLLASRLGGTSWREAAVIGVLMNARGLMELILINIGLEKGLIAPGLFSILVLMAIVTTMAASPLFQLLYGWERRRAPESLPPAALVK